MLPTPPPSPPLGQRKPEDRLGQVLAGRLELTGILGVGAYGVVYTAIDRQTNIPYAVKALNKIGLDARQRKFQQREIRLHHAASQHRNVVSLVKILDEVDCTFVVIEFCPEGDLFASITERGHYVGNDRLAKHIFLQILDAVEHCHSLGIYHRDLKPENVLVSDGGMTAKLADFGLATTDYVTSDYGCGSTFYMSPECHEASPQGCPGYYSAPNDVWSLGVVLINLTCGRNPWKRASTEDSTFRAYLRDPGFLSSILPLAPELDAILRRIFECDPLKRVTLPELRSMILHCSRFTVRPDQGLQQPQHQQQQQQQQQLPRTPPVSEFEEYCRRQQQQQKLCYLPGYPGRTDPIIDTWQAVSPVDASGVLVTPPGSVHGSGMMDCSGAATSSEVSKTLSCSSRGSNSSDAHSVFSVVSSSSADSMSSEEECEPNVVTVTPVVTVPAIRGSVVPGSGSGPAPRGPMPASTTVFPFSGAPPASVTALTGPPVAPTATTATAVMVPCHQHTVFPVQATFYGNFLLPALDLVGKHLVPQACNFVRVH
ncbi:MAG: hypothetical protein M1823_004436 [Watsoniomyces obsoletus]|nr:MAG: hypothetical protein M1823_004436 [Watsoniomyces obsoletus]